MIHELKTHDGPFDKVWSGQKTFEFRKNDRDFKIGDIVVLREYLQNLAGYTGREIHAQIGYVLKGSYDVPDGYCCFSLLGCENIVL